MKLLKEDTFDVVTEVLKEEKTGGFNYFVEGITIQTNIRNLNKRIYPEEYVVREMDRYAIEKLVKNRAYGEFGHPDNAKINEERISHKFVKFNKIGHDYSTKAIVAPEGLGKIVRGIIDIEGVLGMSSRSVGSLKDDGEGGTVKEDLHLITPGDIVVEPSAQAAFVRGIKEGVEFEFNSEGILIESVIDKVDSRYKRNMSIEEKQITLIDIFKEIVEEVARKGRK
jgi:hypothetical protein